MENEANKSYLDRLISCYNGVFDKEPRNVTLREFLFDMSEQHKERVIQLRSCSSKQERDYIKKSLPQATISGVFNGARKAENLAEHSGLICVDIDAKDNPEVPDFEHLKENVLSRFEEVLYAAHSVSGKGFFVIIPLKYPKQHKQQFIHLQQKFADLGITIDGACKDVCRLRCLSYDETPYIYEDAVPYVGVYRETRQPQWQAWQRYSFADDTDERVYQACKEIEFRKIDMTENYEDWIAIGFSLATLGEGGREYFHIVSRQNHKYKARETDQKFTSFLRSASNGCSIGTFFYFCQRFGVRCDGSR